MVQPCLFIDAVAMIRNSLFVFILFLCLAIGADSCKKQELETPSTRIRGKWKLVKTATDDNNNRNIEDVEIIDVPKTLEDVITFEKDNTGVENTTANGIKSLPLNFDWSITGDSVDITYDYHETIRYYLVSVSSGSLTLQTNTQFGLAWYNYNKQ